MSIATVGTFTVPVIETAPGITRAWPERPIVPVVPLVPPIDQVEALSIASGAVTGGLPLVFPLTVSSGANGDQDITVTPKIRVIDAWLVMKGAGTAGSTVTVKNGATAITDVLDVSAKGDKEIVRFTTIDDAQMDIAAAGTLRISHASTGGDFPGAELYVHALHVA